MLCVGAKVRSHFDRCGAYYVEPIGGGEGRPGHGESGPVTTGSGARNSKITIDGQPLIPRHKNCRDPSLHWNDVCSELENGFRSISFSSISC
jgi:hypothetical protein